MSLAGSETAMVRVLEEDPELGRYLSESALPQARAAAVAPLLVLIPGAKSFLIEEAAAHGHLGLLVLDGLIARHVSFGQIGSTEFAGPGDMLHPWLLRNDPVADVDVRWEVLASTRLAALDKDFASRVRGWPGLVAALLDRTAERSDAQVLQAALHQARRVEDRVLLALWHFAGRWGQTGPEGRTVSLPQITGDVLARFVGARRQSVSTALGALADRGAVIRRPDGSMLLPQPPSELDTIAHGQRASDQPPQALRQRA
jgi:hypothetical protein